MINVANLIMWIKLLKGVMRMHAEQSQLSQDHFSPKKRVNLSFLVMTVCGRKIMSYERNSKTNMYSSKQESTKWQHMSH